MLRLVCRKTNNEENYQGYVLAVQSSHAERQEELSQFYRRYDLRCLCVDIGVRMHIKHRIDTGLYYISDNASSLLHAEECEIARARRVDLEGEQTQVEELDWELPEHFNLIPKLRAAAGARSDSPRAAASTKRTEPLFKRLVYTLLDESFSCYFHGRTTTAYTAAHAINESEITKELPETYKGSPFTIFYGERGLAIIERALRAADDESYAIHTEKVLDKPGVTFKVLVFNAQLDSLKTVRELNLTVTSERCLVPVFSPAELALTQSLESWVRGSRNHKAFFGRRLRPFFVDGAEYASPIIAGVNGKEGQRLRFITLTTGLTATEVFMYENRFNAEYVPTQGFIKRLCEFV